MTEQGPGGQTAQWHVPSPFVTHQQMGEVHQSIGELRQGQQSIIATYNHLRGDMLNGFDKLEKAILAAAAPAQEQGSHDEERIKLTMREAVMAAVVIMLASTIVTYLLIRSGVPVQAIGGVAG